MINNLQIMENKSSCSEEIFSNQQQDLQSIELRQRISIKSIQMHNLINDRQKFMSCISNLINEAKNKVDINEKQQLKLGLVYLKECQRILQYAASCGKNLARQLIVTTLHNQASIYQKLWELKNCSSYLEGIIYNYDSFIKDIDTNTSSFADKQPLPLITDISKGRMKQKLARYNLQFCAVSSQLMDHGIALNSVEKALSLMVECIKSSQAQIKYQLGKQYDNDEQTVNLKLDLLMGLVKFDRQIQDKCQLIENQKNILKSAHFSLQIWLQNKINKHDYNVMQKSQYTEYLKNYSIGNIVEIVPIKFDQDTNNVFMLGKQKINIQVYQKEYNFHNKIIMLSTCFFSKATELRLKSIQIYKKNLEERKLSRQYKQSISYHLTAIIIIAIFIPYELKYLTQILLSYQKHYSCNLLQYKTVEQETLQKIMELMGIKITHHEKQQKIEVNALEKQKPVEQIDVKNEYNMKTNFQNKHLQKIDKMKSLKKITKELNDPFKKYEDRQVGKSRENKTSLSITSGNKKDRALSKNQTAKKMPLFKEKEIVKQKDKKTINIQKVKSKKNIHVETTKSRNKDEKQQAKNQYVDQTEQLFFCFTKKTKKTQGVASPVSQLRTSSIRSSSNKSKTSKKNLLSPKTVKIKTVQKIQKSPGKRKNIGEKYYF